MYLVLELEFTVVLLSLPLVVADDGEFNVVSGAKGGTDCFLDDERGVSKPLPEEEEEPTTLSPPPPKEFFLPLSSSFPATASATTFLTTDVLTEKGRGGGLLEMVVFNEEEVVVVLLPLVMELLVEGEVEMAVGNGAVVDRVRGPARAGLLRWLPLFEPPPLSLAIESDDTEPESSLFRLPQESSTSSLSADCMNRIVEAGGICDTSWELLLM